MGKSCKAYFKYNIQPSRFVVFYCIIILGADLKGVGPGGLRCARGRIWISVIYTKTFMWNLQEIEC
jgi:hypothetical protein